MLNSKIATSSPSSSFISRFNPSFVDSFSTAPPGSVQ
ncbi:putative NUDIX domain 5-hydroxy CTP [Listeria monocytogenes]|nr:putative NUDIX domain 5-hydroxy CTP [Listeria monocytogenes]